MSKAKEIVAFDSYTKRQSVGGCVKGWGWRWWRDGPTEKNNLEDCSKGTIYAGSRPGPRIEKTEQTKRMNKIKMPRRVFGTRE